jgi:hypothetical protein
MNCDTSSADETSENSEREGKWEKNGINLHYFFLLS